jgi:hypothetical protein
VPRDVPRELADEIAEAEGAWSLYQIRLVPPKAKTETPLFSVALSLLLGQCWSEIGFSASTPSDVRRAVKILRTAGYVVSEDAKVIHAHRVLRGTREMATEFARLGLLRQDPLSLHSFPARAHRAHKAPAQSRRQTISTPALRYLSTLPRWKWDCTSAQRKGPPAFAEAKTWSAVAWNTALLDEDDTLIDVGMTLSPPQLGSVESKDVRRLLRILREAFAPHGYRVRHLFHDDGHPQVLYAEKSVVSLSRARAERERLNRMLFAT